MLRGNADLAQLELAAPAVDAFSTEAVALTDIVCFQLNAELPEAAREAVLPPALHPTIPAAMSLQVFRVGGSAWGPFNMALLRVSCRSGVRARGFSLAGIADSAAAVAGLRAQLGFPLREGRVRLRHGYDATEIAVQTERGTIAAVKAVDPEPMGQNDVQFTGTLNAARTPRGLRLLQVESQCQPDQAERLRAGPLQFDGAGWGEPLLQPTLVIAAAVVVAPEWLLPPLRFVCKADELAFTGTEEVS